MNEHAEDARSLRSAPELWGGVECTVNRVGDRFFDQLERTGHGTRIDDIPAFAALGLRTVRYPMLWERIAPHGLESADWNWAASRIERMRACGVRPIVGFLHHGSGPNGTSLLDPAFPEKLAAYAAAFAERFPDVDMYTPVNEPLTTARFSALYGHWYPHARDDASFVRALLNQARAIVLAMQAVRRVNPGALLVQTEDLGKVFSTPGVSYQANFENERRWLTFDLLCGREPGPLVKRYLESIDDTRSTMVWLREHTTPPDVVGINYYITSERFLDDRLEHYPPFLHGGNGRHRYADVEAARVVRGGPAGLLSLLRETLERYQLPVAITEVHLGGWREDQMRWLAEAWEAATLLRSEGRDLRAITVWALLGAYDWNSLLTRMDGQYESGAFDVRGEAPRETAMARMVRSLAAGEVPDHPVLANPGWWRRRDRLLYPAYVSEVAATSEGGEVPVLKLPRPELRRPILITGATGTLGQAFARVCGKRAIDCRLVSRREVDIADSASVEAAIERWNPWAIVNAAGYVRVDDAEGSPERCWRENADGPATLAVACAERGIALVTFSSDLVFDGAGSKPYVESDAVAPINAYGRSKADAERRVLEAMPHALLVRTSAFFGPWDDHNTVTRGLRALTNGERFVVASDAVVSPTFVPDLVNCTLDLLIDGESGVWHLANDGAVTWDSLVRTAATLTSIDWGGLEAVPTSELGLTAQRPRYSALGSQRAMLLPSLDDALGRYAREWSNGQIQRASA